MPAMCFCKMPCARPHRDEGPSACDANMRCASTRARRRGIDVGRSHPTPRLKVARPKAQ
jgi:hypothetical protein